MIRNVKSVITSDGGYRGNKTIDLKGIIDEALEKSPCVEKVLVVKRTNETVNMKEGRDLWLQPLLDAALGNHVATIMDVGRSFVYFIYIRFNRKTKRDVAYYSRLHGLYCIHFQKCIQL